MTKKKRIAVLFQCTRVFLILKKGGVFLITKPQISFTRFCSRTAGSSLKKNSFGKFKNQPIHLPLDEDRISASEFHNIDDTCFVSLC